MTAALGFQCLGFRHDDSDQCCSGGGWMDSVVVGGGCGGKGKGRGGSCRMWFQIVGCRRHNLGF
ncbi:hypothetical protein HanRHA438_Chr09g0402731 [Helianthus annuus]|nr:hypothetical protein HanIR_Chr09g0421861 [Helianthus annuus]KAJ0888506.1 hypothetical protein HanRHA438_Chr09g0402731 [Helianthus annuus]